MSLLQAMSIGVPAIVTNIGGMAEVVRLADAGICVPVGDAAAMAEAIVHLAARPTARATFARNGLHAYKKHFTLAQMNEAYMRLYRNE